MALFKKSVLALSVTTAIALSSSISDVYAASEKTNFNSEIVNAVEYGDLEKLEALVYMGYSPDEAGDFGTTALLRAAYHNSLEATEFLLNNGADVDATDIGGATALHIASRENHVKIVKALIKAGASVDLADGSDNTALMRASAEGNKEIAKLLIAAGSDVNKTNAEGETALVYATDANDYVLVDSLVKSGASKQIIDSEGYSVDEIASRKGNNLLVAKLDNANSDHIEMFVAKAEPKIESKKVLKKLKAENKINLAQATTLGRAEPKIESKDWLNGLRDAFDQAGAFEVAAAVENYEQGSKYILLDLGSFKDKAFAEKRLAKLQAEGGKKLEELGLTILEKGSGSNKTYNVNAGILSEKSEALDICRDLVAKGISCRPVESVLITAEQFDKFSTPYQVASAPSKTLVEKTVDSANNGLKSIFDAVSPAKITEKKQVETAALTNKVTKAPAEIVTKKDLKPSIAVEGRHSAKIVAPKITAKAPKVVAPKPVIEAPKVAVKTPKVEIPKLVAKVKKPEVIIEEEANLLDIAGMKSEEVEVKVAKPAVSKPVIKEVVKPVIIAKATPVTKPVIAVQRHKKQPVKPLNSDDDVSNLLHDIFQNDNSTPPVDEPIVYKATAPKVKIAAPAIAQTSPIQRLAKLDDAFEQKPKPKLPPLKIRVQKIEPQVTENNLNYKYNKLPQLEGASKFIVAKPIKVTPEPLLLRAPKKSASNDDYYVYNGKNASFDKLGSKWVRISYFQNARVATAYWNSVRKNPELPTNLVMRAVRSISSGKPYQAAQIGPFMGDADALSFCNNYAPQATRCQIHNNVRDNYAPVVPGYSNKGRASTGRHSQRNRIR